MDKKFIFIGIGGLLVVAVLVIILVTGKHQTTTVSSMPNTLVVWDYNNEKAAYDPVITGFQQAKNVKVQYIVKNPSSYFEDTVNAMAAGTGPDVWIVPANILPQYKDKLTPMPNGGFANSKAKLSDVEAYQNLYPPVVSQDNIYDNKIYGVPLSMDTLKLYVNTALTGTAYSDYYNAHRSDSNLSQLATVISQPQSWDDIVTADKIITNLFITKWVNGEPQGADDLEEAKFFTFEQAVDVVGEHHKPLLRLIENNLELVGIRNYGY